MKKNYFIKRTALVLMSLLIMLPTLTAQSRYKHVPRVKVDKIAPVDKAVTNNKIAIDFEPETTVTKEQEPVKLTEVATASASDVVIVKEKRSTPVTLQHEKISNKVNKEGFTQQVKQESKLLQVKDVKKTNLLGFLLWFVIVVILAVVLLAIAFILLGVLSFSLWYILLIIGAVVLVAAIVLLILGVI